MDVNTLFKERGSDFNFEILTGQDGVNRQITVCDLNRPGLALSGFFEDFPYERVQVIGISEYKYLKRLNYNTQIDILTKIFAHRDAVCCILTRNFNPTEAMLEVFSGFKVPLLRTELMFASFVSDLSRYLEGKLSPSVKMHGVLTNVYGLGVLIVGKSSMGKSECALELIRRGHKLIADDVVNIIKHSGDILIGSSLEITKHLIELRGVGIINIKDLFGMDNVLDETNIELVIRFEEFGKTGKYERLGLDERHMEILGVKVPEIAIPVGPGRNLAIIVETASLDRRLKNKGCFTAKDLDCKLRKKMK